MALRFNAFLCLLRGFSEMTGTRRIFYELSVVVRQRIIKNLMRVVKDRVADRPPDQDLFRIFMDIFGIYSHKTRDIVSRP